MEVYGVQSDRWYMLGLLQGMIAVMLSEKIGTCIPGRWRICGMIRMHSDTNPACHEVRQRFGSIDTGDQNCGPAFLCNPYLSELIFHTGAINP